MSNPIFISHGESSILANLLGVSLPTVRTALRGNSRTKLSDAIRKLAIERGGVLVPDPQSEEAAMLLATQTDSNAFQQTALSFIKSSNNTVRDFLNYLVEVDEIKVTDLKYLLKKVGKR